MSSKSKNLHFSQIRYKKLGQADLFRFVAQLTEKNVKKCEKSSCKVDFFMV